MTNIFLLALNFFTGARLRSLRPVKVDLEDFLEIPRHPTKYLRSTLQKVILIVYGIEFLECLKFCHPVFHNLILNIKKRSRYFLTTR
jgi:hypothetical protein